MPKLEVELDEHGEFVGTVPGELSAVIDRIKTSAHGEGFGKGAQKAAEEAKAQIASAIAAEKAKWEATIPTERAKWSEIEELNKHLKSQIDATTQQARKTVTEREEAHAQEITRRMDRESKRDARIKDLVNQSLKALAKASGARDESLPELEVILQHRIGYTDDMEPFVKAEDGTPAKTAAGNPIAIDAFVRQYLDNHPHHRKPPAGKPGGVTGGASFHGGGTTVTPELARARIDSGDRSAGAVDDLFKATRRRAS